MSVICRNTSCSILVHTDLGWMPADEIELTLALRRSGLSSFSRSVPHGSGIGDSGGRASKGDTDAHGPLVDKRHTRSVWSFISGA